MNDNHIADERKNPSADCGTCGYLGMSAVEGARCPRCGMRNAAAIAPRAADFCSNLSKTPERADADTAGARDGARRFVRDFMRLAGFTMSDFQQEGLLNLFLRCAAGASERADVLRCDGKLLCRHCLAPVVLMGDGYEHRPERADAEKDAALTDDDIRAVFLCVTGFDEGVTPYDVIGFARAILAANKDHGVPSAPPSSE